MVDLQSGSEALMCPRCGKNPPRPNRKFCSRKCAAGRPPFSPAAQAKRFWSYIDKSDDGCWPWTAFRNALGYGWSSWAGKGQHAHRIAWPDHLFIATQRENLEDCWAKRRHAHGEKQYNAKLTDDIVRRLRADAATGIPVLRIAKNRGLPRSIVRRAINRTTWKHVT